MKNETSKEAPDWIKKRPTWQLILIVLLLLAVEQGLNFTFIDHFLLILDEMVLGGIGIATGKELLSRISNFRRKKHTIEVEEE